MAIPASSGATPANSSILTLVQLVLQSMGVVAFGQPSSVVGNSNQDVMQTLALVNMYSDELAREHQWEQLCNEYRFTTSFYQYTGTSASGSAALTGLSSTANLDTTFMVSGTGIPNDTYVQSVDSGSQVTLSNNATASGSGVTFTFGKTKYALPSDFDRQIDRTQWDKSKRWEALGPETAQQWQWLKSSYISTGPRVRYRLMGGYFQIWPLLATNELMGFEYVSKNWVLAKAAATPSRKSFQADDDTCIFPDQLMTSLIRLAYFTVKGFDTTSFAESYRNQVDLAKANDGGSTTLSMAPRMGDILISIDNIPDSGYGS